MRLADGEAGRRLTHADPLQPKWLGLGQEKAGDMERSQGESRLAERVALHGYETSLDRAGLALGAGGLVGGIFASALVLVGAGPTPLSVALGFAMGTVITAMAALAVAGPLWLIAHVLGRRGPVSAVLIGALAGFALFLGGQTYFYGLFAMPPTDSQTLMFRWISAAATSLILASLSALIGLVMWRVAYRRIA
jgi:hypothetical protein